MVGERRRYEKIKYVSIDIETCGVDEDTCDIIEFAAVLDDLTDMKPMDELPVFHRYFIKDKYVGEPYALSMHPKIFRAIAERSNAEDKWKYISATKLGNAFKKFLVKYGYEEKHSKVVITVAGKNFSSFDLQFLKKKTDLLKHVDIRHRVIDPSILYIENGDNAPPATLECKRRAGIVGEVAHTAEADAKDVIQLVRNGIGDRFRATLQ